jgi:hypothetical protein
VLISYFLSSVALCSAYDKNPAIFFAAIAIVSAMVVVIPLTLAIVKRRRMARPFESHSLTLDHGPPSTGSMRYRNSTGVGGSPIETTHLLTLKDAYDSFRPRDNDKTKIKPKGRSIVMKDNLEQDPFRLSGGLWDARHLPAAATETWVVKRSQDKAASAVATGLDTDDETKTFIQDDT